MQNTKLKINHLYSNYLNIYGDLGNIIALKYRSESRNISVEVCQTEIGQEHIETADIYFLGGGQDLDQIRVFEDLLRHRSFIQSEVEKGKVFLLICGGYQLFGKFFLDAQGNLIKGLEILDIETKAPGEEVKSRCIGNIVVEMSSEFTKYWDIDTNFSKYLVGFENHGGQTFFVSKKVCPIGRVISGYGNNYFEKLEGGYYKNVIGSYCHGSLLPKNPHLADALIAKALRIQRKELADLDNEVEMKAHKFILKPQF